MRLGIRNVRGKIVEVSPEFESVMKQLEEIKDLKLIVFDPLASFTHADINADPAVGDYLMCLLSDLACIVVSKMNDKFPLRD